MASPKVARSRHWKIIRTKRQGTRTDLARETVHNNSVKITELPDVGVKEWQARKLEKLNDLIPELQTLVSAKTPSALVKLFTIIRTKCPD